MGHNKHSLYAATINIVFKDMVNYGEWFAVRRPYGQKEEGLTETWGDEGSLKFPV